MPVVCMEGGSETPPATVLDRCCPLSRGGRVPQGMCPSVLEALTQLENQEDAAAQVRVPGVRCGAA